MTCSGCYTKSTGSYCPACRKTLFDRARVEAVLAFDAPQAGNLEVFQEHTKRLSISGVQLKYSLKREGKMLALTDTNGEYILKPVPPTTLLEHREDVPENEHLTMQIAQKYFGIATAASALIRFKDGAPAYITRRFDVRPGGDKFLQEDFAQLTGRSRKGNGETFKYQGSYEEIGEVIRKFVAAAPVALEQLFQLIVFNYIFSNGDAHLKNFSLRRIETEEYELAPAYDLMSTVVHTPHESDMALDLCQGDMESAFYKRYGYYGRENFMELSRRFGIVQTRAQRMLDIFEARRNEVYGMIENSFLSAEVKKIYRRNFDEKLRRIGRL